MPHTAEELVDLVLSLRAELAACRTELAECRAELAQVRAESSARIAALEAENAELRARLAKDSSNSHKPPSSDSPYKGKPPREPGQRKAGGQPGHKGATRAWLPPEKVTRREVLRVPFCACGASLAGLPAGQGTWSRQVVEIPKIEPVATEYVFESVRCPCCQRLNVPAAPAEAATCTGPNLTALSATLVGQYHLSRDAASDLLTSILGLPVCAATVQDCCEQLGEALGTATAEIDASLPTEPVVHMDETSWKQGGDLRWLWIAVGNRVTSFAVHARRGLGQLEAWFPAQYSGVVVCDRLRAYERFPFRQLCWSHLIRDLQAVIDFGQSGAELAGRMLAGVERMFTYWHLFKEGRLDRAGLLEKTRGFRDQFARFCLMGSRQSADKRWRNLGADMRRLRADVFRFLHQEGIEPTNNTAERGLRGAVIWRRGSQGTRSDDGSIFVARILTAVANCRRQKRKIVDFLAETLLAHRAGRPTPSLMPVDA